NAPPGYQAYPLQYQAYYQQGYPQGYQYTEDYQYTAGQQRYVPLNDGYAWGTVNAEQVMYLPGRPNMRLPDVVMDIDNALYSSEADRGYLKGYYAGWNDAEKNKGKGYEYFMDYTLKLRADGPVNQESGYYLMDHKPVKITATSVETEFSAAYKQGKFDGFTDSWLGEDYAVPLPPEAYSNYYYNAYSSQPYQNYQMYYGYYGSNARVW
ncbi:hypothetical protein JW868_04190, partial [Candidatus Woesearchaeota archaeon]|nr:hypothetical protein [Candidatus Woesearchaeota archaeon]